MSYRRHDLTDWPGAGAGSRLYTAVASWWWPPAVTGLPGYQHPADGVVRDFLRDPSWSISRRQEIAMVEVLHWRVHPGSAAARRSSSPRSRWPVVTGSPGCAGPCSRSILVGDSFGWNRRWRRCAHRRLDARLASASRAAECRQPWRSASTRITIPGYSAPADGVARRSFLRRLCARSTRP